MEREAVVIAVRDICSGTLDNEVIDHLLDMLEAALPHSDICDLMFQNFQNLTPAQVVEEAYKREAEYAAAGIREVREV